jgi:hypothetical protein
MSHTITSTAPQWATVATHLRARPERVAFLTADDVDDQLTVTDLLLIDDDHLEPGPWCVQLTDDAQQRLLQWAAVRDGWLIEIHSHLGALSEPAQFSETDTAGLETWVPHVRWRLRQRPYAALVFGLVTIDGVAWAGPKGDPPTQITAWTVAGGATPTTGLSLAQFTVAP